MKVGDQESVFNLADTLFPVSTFTSGYDFRNLSNRFLTVKTGSGGLGKKEVSHISGTIFHLVKSDFRSDESLIIKTGSCPTEMVDPSFDAEYPTYPGLVQVSDPKKVNFRFYPQKTG